MGMKPGGRIDVRCKNGKSSEQWHGDERRTCLMDGAGFVCGRDKASHIGICE
jgi:hypothetical protein